MTISKKGLTWDNYCVLLLIHESLGRRTDVTKPRIDLNGRHEQCELRMHVDLTLYPAGLRRLFRIIGGFRGRGHGPPR